MSSNEPRYSAYATLVINSIYALRESGGGRFTAEQLAAALGFKLTHNFRRRLREAAQMGVVKLNLLYADSKRMVFEYELIPYEEQVKNAADIPF